MVDKGSVVEERIYLGSYEVWRKRSTGTLVQERQTLHIMEGQRRIAMVETLTVDDYTEIDEGDRTPRSRYQLDDHLSTTLLDIDFEGAISSYEEYHPYGSTAWYADDGSLSGSPKRYKYTGMERDDETGLQYHSARYYAPWLGRWSETDPTGLRGGANRFAYTHCSPAKWQDMTGCGAGGVDTLDSDTTQDSAPVPLEGPPALRGPTDPGLDLVGSLEQSVENIERFHKLYPDVPYGYRLAPTPDPLTEQLLTNCSTQMAFNMTRVLGEETTQQKLYYFTTDEMGPDGTSSGQRMIETYLISAGNNRVDGPVEGRLFMASEMRSASFFTDAVMRGDVRTGGFASALVRAGQAGQITSLSQVDRNTVIQMFKFTAKTPGQTFKFDMAPAFAATGPVPMNARSISGITSNQPINRPPEEIIPLPSVTHRTWQIQGTVLIGTQDGLITTSGKPAGPLIPGRQYTIIWGANLNPPQGRPR